MEMTISDFIAGLSLLVSIGLAVYSLYNSNRLKTLESSLEIQKNKSLLNDKKNRDVFEKFIQSFIDLLFANKDRNEKQIKQDEELLKKEMIEVKKFLLINGSGKLVKEFNNFIFITQSSKVDNNTIYHSIDKLLKQFRNEIGVENEGLDKNSLIQLFVNEDINLKLNS